MQETNRQRPAAGTGWSQYWKYSVRFKEIYFCHHQPADGQEPVQKVDGKSEDLRSVLTGVVTDIKHPANYRLPHVRLDLNLDEGEIVWMAREISEYQTMYL